MTKKKQAMTIKYEGNSPETEVLGLGIFKKDQEVTFEDQDQIEKVSKLLKTNQNFKEV